jgi:predicted sulfurtransferase
LTPEQFHHEIASYLEQYSNNSLHSGPSLSPQNLSPQKDSSLVLLDVRNAYETEIGRFEITSENGDDVLIPVHDPLTRTVGCPFLSISPSTHSFLWQFSDFKRYIDHNLHEFVDKKVLMYCTGRAERPETLCSIIPLMSCQVV